MRASSAIAIGAVACGLALASPAPAHPRHGGHGGRAPTAFTDLGAVRGFTAEGVDKFLGLPYAAPPVGERRWRPPAPATPWRGVRDATVLPPSCAQRENSNGPRSESEDCLYLSVYRPARAHGRLPVLFWIHGGGLNTGSGNQHDGALMARTNGIVVVSINYRLGAFGFLALPALTEEGGGASGNYGLLDQLAAMKWTQRNIAAFGGDPRAVTIAGESAGGFSVCDALASPLARGRFARAIIQSGGCPSQTLATGETAGTNFMTATGCTDLACLRAKPAGALLDTNPQPPASTTVGGSYMPIAPAEAIASGQFTRVPVIVGANHDEGRTFAQGFANFTQQQYEAFVASQFGDRAAAVLEQYPWSAFESPYTAAYAIGAIWTDSGVLAGIGGCGTRTLAQQLSAATRTYAYSFDDRNAPGLNQNLPGYKWGAGHAMELAYMWPSFDNGIPLYPQLTPAQRVLSHEMVLRWGAFTRWGVPWPEYRGQRWLSLRPGGQTRLISDADYAADHKCGFWSP